jgi:purine-nucleoside phosphorylase
MSINREVLERAASYVDALMGGLKADAAVICGSGWSAVLEILEVQRRIEYSNIPGLGSPGVVGHAGELSLCESGGKRLLIFKGRRHFYEGVGWTPVAIPVYLTLRSGAKHLLLTNSAGAVNAAYRPGDLMLITDHINLIGDNPLVGPHDPIWGPRFPDQSAVYALEAREQLRRAATKAKVTLHEGVYAATRGPVYETPAEVRAWKLLGADAVGMSTIPEAQLASAAGLRVGGLSCMTNMAAGILDQPLDHREVTETAAKAMPRMTALLREWINGL